MPPLNPWVLLGGLLLVLSLCAGSAYEGHKIGVNAQKAEDQQQFDAINQKLAEQKAAAAQQYRDKQAGIIARQHDQEVFKANLEKEHVKNQDTSNRLRDAYAAYGLRFRAAESAGSGDSDRCPEGPGAGCAGNASAAIVQLPEALTRNLRQLAYDADRLNDDYRLCYGYVNKKPVNAADR